MNQDVLTEIAIHVDIDDLENLCIANTTFNKICHNKYFIEEKLKQLSQQYDIDNQYLRESFTNLLYYIKVIKLAKQIIDYMKELNNFNLNPFPFMKRYN